MNKLRYSLFLLPLLLFMCTDHTVLIGNRNLELGDYERAIHLFSKVVDKNPDSFDARVGLGKALLQQLSTGIQNEDTWRKCITNLEAARTLKPSVELTALLSTAWNQRAHFFLQFKDTSGALHDLLRSIEYDKTNIKSLNLAGILYFNRIEYSKALSMFSLVTHYDSTSPTGYFNTAMILWASGDCKNARNAWKTAQSKSPGNNELHYWLSLTDTTCPER